MKTKHCSKCNRRRVAKFFHKCSTQADGLHTICKSCRISHIVKSQVKAKIQGTWVESVQTIREKAVMCLGGKCVRCGFSDMRALQIDHKFGGGMKELQKSAYRCYKRITMNPKAAKRHYQVLCANDNWIKRSERHEVANRKY